MSFLGIFGKPLRLPLQDWAALDDIRQKIDAEAEAGEWQRLPDLIRQFISDCGVNFRKFEQVPWFEVVEMYVECIRVNQPTKKFPILTTRQKNKRMPWEYEGRTWYFWLNLFSRHYGWQESVIAEMDIDDAIGLYQEIQIDEQLENEWQYGLSEIAYPYDKATKTSRYKPLTRPDWMLHSMGDAKKPVKKSRMPKSILPKGNIISLDGT